MRGREEEEGMRRCGVVHRKRGGAERRREEE